MKRILILFCSIGCASFPCSSRADSNPASFLSIPAVSVDGGVVFSDVSYLPQGREEKLDVYLPHSGKSRPCVLYIHGGGWFSGDKNAGRFREIIVSSFLKAGVGVVSVNYNLKPPRWPRNLWDCKRALRFLKAHARDLGVNPDHIVVCGGSAGGHLSEMMALTAGNPADDEPAAPDQPDSSLAGGIGMCGIVDLRLARINHEPNTWGNVLFAQTKYAVDDTDTDKVFSQIWKDASPLFQIAKNSIPLLLVHGDRDTIVEIGQSETLFKIGKELGAPIELLRVPGAPHGIRTCRFPGVMEKVIAFAKSCRSIQRAKIEE